MEAYITAILNKWFQDQTDFNKIMKINVNFGKKYNKKLNKMLKKYCERLQRN